jgi:hypothetical protein
VQHLLEALLVLDPGRRIRAEDALKLPVFSGEDAIMLVPPRLVRSEEYGNMESVRLVDHLDELSLEDLLGDVLRSARLRWSDL